ncbi:carotenoid oxygenase family protein [Novosphingobium sp. KACC 22771]|uniref:carotenoid oxygenase family protein n=1 Tax=Novosphingobium sp. KACC 22771 TaxID=3025670 RepID=UPI002365F46C|nr:carotenoid oxygenase family protein [Novosphingobium sp. KACC 22771]WDF74528.1 carotenoid oxygenase family protein [Novosphingobium sp. KACC 22771]
MAHFPDTRNFRHSLRPLRLECDIIDLEVEGTVPPELNGVFHRVQPDAQFAPIFENDQFFNGDGLISQFTFRNGRVDLKQRYALTDKLKVEREAGRALFGAYRNPLTDDPSVKGMIRGTANTTPIVHAGKLFALKEDSPPLIMDPVTMETQGYGDFNGKMRNQTFSAHPKIDPITGNMCNFGYAATGLLTRDVSYMEIDPQGELLFETFFEVPYYCMMHDFAVTRDYAIFHLCPITSNWDRLRANKPHFGFDTTLPVYLAVLPRGGKAEDMRYFKAPRTVFASHVMNAYNEGTRITFDIPQSEGNAFPFFPDINDAPFDPIAARPYLHRWVVDMASNSDEFEQFERVSDLIGEFPKIDERYLGQPYTHGWMLVMDPDMPFEGEGVRASGFRMNKIGHFNRATLEEKTWFCGPQSLIQEPQFVPRHKDAAEGDGYLLALVDNQVSNYSELAIFEALDIAAGPLARIHVPFRMRNGLHGTWADASALSSAA